MTNITEAYRAKFNAMGKTPRAPELHVVDEITGTLRLRDEVAQETGKPRGPANGEPESAASTSVADDSQLSETLTYLSDAVAMIIDRLDALVELSEIIANKQHELESE